MVRLLVVLLIKGRLNLWIYINIFRLHLQDFIYSYIWLAVHLLGLIIENSKKDFNYSFLWGKLIECWMCNCPNEYFYASYFGDVYALCLLLFIDWSTHPNWWGSSSFIIVYELCVGQLLPIFEPGTMHSFSFRCPLHGISQTTVH